MYAQPRTVDKGYPPGCGGTNNPLGFYVLYRT